MARPAAVFFDRDDTLVVDVPYNGDPLKVSLMPGARQAIDRLREAAIPVAVVSNQSGIARGYITMQQVDEVNRRVEELLGTLAWFICPHGPQDRCICRKPAPGLLLEAAAHFGVRPQECVFIGNSASDLEAAAAAGARGILIPTEQTPPVVIQSAPAVAGSLLVAVDMLLDA